jgi:hypothetical protein
MPVTVMEQYVRNVAFGPPSKVTSTMHTKFTSLRAYFSFQTYFSIYCPWDLHKIYHAYKLINIYFICKIGSPLAVDTDIMAFFQLDIA